MKLTLLKGALAVILLSAIPLFGHLDSAPLNIWDEARLATSALEMNKSHDWLVTRVNGAPDMWSTKPPLMIWVQALAVKVLGPCELAVRLPSALAALATCLLVFWFFGKKAKHPLAGVISVMVLITSQGYVMDHGTRTGDYDSLLTFFTTAYAIFFFIYLEEGTTKNLWATFIFLTLAALTKGIQSLMFLPAMLMYCIYKKRFLFVAKQKNFYAGLAVFVCVVAGYYLLREHYNAGYLAAVNQNEISGRYTAVIESHVGDGWYYYNFLTGEHFGQWYLLLIPGLVVGLVSREKMIKDVIIFSSILVASYFIILSNAQTKICWYEMPMFPFLAIMVGVFLFFVCRLLTLIPGWNGFLLHNPAPYIFLFLVFIVPYQAVSNKSLDTAYKYYSPIDKTDMKLYLKGCLHGDNSLEGAAILNDGIEQDLGWYYEALNYYKPQVVFENRSNINSFGKIIAYKADSKKYIEDSFKNTIVGTFNNVTIYKLNGRK